MPNPDNGIPRCRHWSVRGARDPLAVANASLQATAQATQTTLDLGRQFLGGLGINLGGPAASAPSAATTGASRIPRANARQAVEYVIRRAGSQMGVPYSWGGGSLQGPSKGVDSGANTVGFDCSGLVRYAFAGVGVLIPRFSGDQYNAGRHVPPAEAKRGDLIFTAQAAASTSPCIWATAKCWRHPEAPAKSR